MEFNLGDKVRYKRTRETGIITKIDGNSKIYGTIYTLEITMGKKILHLLPMIEERIGDYIEKVNEPTPYAPYTHQEMSLDAMEYCLPYLKGCEQPKLKPLGEAPKIRSMKFWNEAKNQKPFDTTTRFKDMRDSELVDVFTKNIREYLEKVRYDLPIYTFELPYLKHPNKGEEKMRTGLPYSVNFVEKHKRTTLVWKNFKISNYIYMSYQGKEDYETTKSEAHNEKFSKLYGFLMAYFKRVHKNKSKTQLKKYLNTVVYPMSKMSQLAFLQGVFYENCGLGFKEAKDYLDKVEKGIEIKND